MSGPVASDAPSKHRIEALSDGIFAVAMTLLVIELKLPDPHAIGSVDELASALIGLLPKVASWIISFFVLAIFWIAHHRLFHYVRHVDQALLWQCIVQLALVALMLFSSALSGEFGGTLLAQAIYNGNMMLLALVSILITRYVHAHPALTAHRFEDGTYHAALVRVIGLIVIAGVATAIAWWRPIFSNMAYLLMWPIGRFSRRFERKARADAAKPILRTS